MIQSLITEMLWHFSMNQLGCLNMCSLTHATSSSINDYDVTD